MNPEIHHIPLEQIDTTTLTRDRTHLAPEPLAELRTSILRHGLRLPIELLRLQHPQDHPYTLISGLRRLTVFQSLAAEGLTAFTQIPALIRETQTLPQAYTAMIEENAIRADLSPYEQGRIATQAVTAGAFPTTDEAIDTLYASCAPSKRSRLRAMAELHETLGHVLSAPETLSYARALRIVNAIRMGHGDAMEETLSATRPRGPETDWQSLLPYLEAAEDEQKTPEAPKHARGPRGPNTTHFFKGQIRIRRQTIPGGYALRITGEYGMRDVVESMVEDLERMYGDE